MLNIPWGISDTEKQNPHSFVHSSYLLQMSLPVGLPEGAGGRVRSISSRHHHNHHGPPRSHTNWGVNNRPVGGRGSEIVSPHHNQSRILQLSLLETVLRAEWLVLNDREEFTVAAAFRAFLLCFCRDVLWKSSFVATSFMTQKLTWENDSYSAGKIMKLPAFHGKRSFSTAFTTADH
jgi:hypothetical protein